MSFSFYVFFKILFLQKWGTTWANVFLHRRIAIPLAWYRLLLGFIVSSLARKDKTWPRLPNKCPRSAKMHFFGRITNIGFCSIWFILIIKCFFFFFQFKVLNPFFLSYALYRQVHIEFTEGEDRITLEGPTKDVQMVQSQIEVIVADLVSLPDVCTIVLMYGHHKWLYCDGNAMLKCLPIDLLMC